MTLPEQTNASEQTVNWIYIGMVSIIAAIGGLLFGFDTGVISGTIGGNIFFLFTGVSLIAFLFALITMRETKGLHLEEIDRAFEKSVHS